MTSLSRRSNVGTRGAPPLSSPFLPASSRGWSGCWCSAWINCQGRDICFLSQARYHNTKIPFVLGAVGHFGLAVRNPKKSARWFQRTLGLRKEFDFKNGVAVGNDNITIALFKGKPSPSTLDHMSFHLPDMTTLRKALTHLKKHKVNIEDPGTRLGRKLQVRNIWAYGSMIPMAIPGNFR